jgi:hypothetical protein
MATKNIIQAFRFPAFALCGDIFPKEMTPFFQTGEQEKIAELMTPELAEVLANVGAKSPTDLVTVNVTLGAFLFDCYLTGVNVPNTPMGKHIASKRAQELAQSFDKDEFELPDYAITAVRNVLTNDNLWAKILVTGLIEKGDDQKHPIPLSSAGAAYYNQILSAAAELVYDPDLDS